MSTEQHEELDRYYSDWDRWFAEEHDGTPVVWVLAESSFDDDLPDENCRTLSFFPTLGAPKVAVPGEIHKELHRISASSTIEALQKRNEFLGWEAYEPHPEWDLERGCWRK